MEWVIHLHWLLYTYTFKALTKRWTMIQPYCVYQSAWSYSSNDVTGDPKTKSPYIYVGDWTFGSSPHPRKCSLTRLQGSNERKSSIPEGVGWSLRIASSKTRTFGDEGYHLRLAEGDEWLLRSASSKTKTFGGEGYHLRLAEGDEWLLGSTSLKTRTFG